MLAMLLVLIQLGSGTDAAEFPSWRDYAVYVKKLSESPKESLLVLIETGSKHDAMNANLVLEHLRIMAHNNVDNRKLSVDRFQKSFRENCKARNLAIPLWVYETLDSAELNFQGRYRFNVQPRSRTPITKTLSSSNTTMKWYVGSGMIQTESLKAARISKFGNSYQLLASDYDESRNLVAVHFFNQRTIGRSIELFDKTNMQWSSSVYPPPLPGSSGDNPSLIDVEVRFVEDSVWLYAVEPSYIRIQQFSLDNGRCLLFFDTYVIGELLVQGPVHRE